MFILGVRFFFNPSFFLPAAASNLSKEIRNSWLILAFVTSDLKLAGKGD
jgi:hypothetical protein